MKKITLSIAMAAMLMLNLCSCEKDELLFNTDDLSVKITEGENWIHDFPLFLGINLKNPPQFAIWIEDTDENYISTLFATKKIATEGWVSNKDNRRKEALPHWCYQRGIIYDDGLLLPTKEEPLTDGISGATPTAGIELKISPEVILDQFVIKVEVNHSTDFNIAYPENAKPEDSNYSGGEEGSGQPALVYSSLIDLSSGQIEYQLELIGHSSPDGTDGNIYQDLSGITSAIKIIDTTIIKIK
jgi:hypothetical protein